MAVTQAYSVKIAVIMCSNVLNTASRECYTKASRVLTTRHQSPHPSNIAISFVTVQYMFFP